MEEVWLNSPAFTPVEEGVFFSFDQTFKLTLQKEQMDQGVQQTLLHPQIRYEKRRF